MNTMKWVVIALTTAVLTACTEDTAQTKETDKLTAIAQDQGALERSKQYPLPVESIIEQGVEIIDTFEAPAGMIGYAGMMRGQPIAIYVTPDKKHAVVGSLIDAEGVNLTTEVMERLVEGPRMERVWKELEDSAWVADGSDDAPVIIYTFTDANCPYCHKFREAADPWIKAGKVQFRHILVAILRKSSMTKGATILGSDDPEAMMEMHHEEFAQGGIEINKAAVEKGQVRVQLNTNMMQRLGYGATPTSFFKNSEGKVKAIQGMPQGDVFEQMMGSAKPQ
ncbi:thiol:disulfide interchange protein DsbG [Kangiella shandongensis]|uniref:thiol:disulfide interchange protein DsbG n=1 Tax=Kangiella shandongensis TaxID=2763258 RepID=UPI001CBE6968|nr:thiol:disulfide interchange protein DsbG [Kangiella shandongensis]